MSFHHKWGGLGDVVLGCAPSCSFHWLPGSSLQFKTSGSEKERTKTWRSVLVRQISVFVFAGLTPWNVMVSPRIEMLKSDTNVWKKFQRIFPCWRQSKLYHVSFDNRDQLSGMILWSLNTLWSFLFVRFQQRELKKREQHSWRRTNNAYKYREAPILHMLKQTDESYTTNVVPPEAIISIRVYHPARTYVSNRQAAIQAEEFMLCLILQQAARYPCSMPHVFPPEKGEILRDQWEKIDKGMTNTESEPCFLYLQIKISQEFQVLGSQKLTELRDKIACVADTVVVGEFSEKPNLPQDIIAGVCLGFMHNVPSCPKTTRTQL